MKQATTLEQQIAKLRSRKVEIADEEKAKEVLLDIGYYRLGFYFFPFEKSYPNLRNRNHMMQDGTRFEDAVALYYFDFDVRNLLNRYISRIEVAFRTYMTYYLSNKYANDTTWFVNPSVVSQTFCDNFETTCYISIKKNAAIRRHHSKYRSDQYAPAWKTMEYMTLGNMLVLYQSLLFWMINELLLNISESIKQRYLRIIWNVFAVSAISALMALFYMIPSYTIESCEVLLVD